MHSIEPTSLAIACTLSGAELPARLHTIAALGQDALLDSKIAIGHATLRFAPRDGIRERLEAVVAAESSCCAFFGFDIAHEGDEIVLHVTTPDDAQVLLEEFAAAFDPSSEVAA